MEKEKYDNKKVLEALRVIAGHPSGELRAGLILKSIKDKTAENYKTEALRLLRWARIQRELDPGGVGLKKLPLEHEFTIPTVEKGITTEEIFSSLGNECRRQDYISYLAAHARVYCTPFDKTRAALRMGQMMAGTEVWAIEEEAVCAEKGAFGIAAETRQEVRKGRGTLSARMIDDLLNFVRSRNREMATAMEVQIGACLRISELLSLTPSSITEKGIILSETKRDRAKARRSAKERHSLKRVNLLPRGKHTLKLLNKLKGRCKHNTLIFPKKAFTKPQYNAMLKRAAAELKWDEDLNFGGSHTLRHAGIGESSRVLIEKYSVEEIGNILLMSEGMVLFYARSIEERKRKVRIPEFVKKRFPHTVVSELIESSDSEEEDTMKNPLPEEEEGRKETQKIIPLALSYEERQRRRHAAQERAREEERRRKSRRKESKP